MIEVAYDEPTENVVFGSDVIDLSDIDLAALNELPSTALRTAIARVRAELSRNGDKSAVYAGFQSSLRAIHAEPNSEGSAGPDVTQAR